MKKSRKGKKEVKWDSNFSIPSFCFPGGLRLACLADQGFQSFIGRIRGLQFPRNTTLRPKPGLEPWAWPSRKLPSGPESVPSSWSRRFSTSRESLRIDEKAQLDYSASLGFLLLYASIDFPTNETTDSPASVSPVSSHFIAQTGVGCRSAEHGYGGFGRLPWFRHDV